MTAAVGLCQFLIFVRSGSCVIIIAANMITQPTASRAVGISLRMTMPASTANTDSRLISRDATVGRVYFCPTICRV